MTEPRRGRPPPGPPPAINHFPFPSARGRTGAGGLRMSEKRRRSGAVWCWPTAKFLHWKPRRREPHTLQTHARTRLHVLETRATEGQKPHCPQREGHARARALLVLNPAGSTSSAHSGSGLLGGRCLDPAHAITERYSEHGQEQRASAGEGSPAPPSPSQTKVRRRECTL